MVRALRTHTPAVRKAFGRSLGPMTTSATTPISASSDQLKSNIALHQSETLTLSTTERGSNTETPLRQIDGSVGRRSAGGARIMAESLDPRNAGRCPPGIAIRASRSPGDNPAWPCRKALRRRRWIGFEIRCQRLGVRVGIVVRIVLRLDPRGLAGHVGERGVPPRLR